MSTVLNEINSNIKCFVYVVSIGTVLSHKIIYLGI